MNKLLSSLLVTVSLAVALFANAQDFVVGQDVLPKQPDAKLSDFGNSTTYHKYDMRGGTSTSKKQAPQQPADEAVPAQQPTATAAVAKQPTKTVQEFVKQTLGLNDNQAPSQKPNADQYKINPQMFTHQGMGTETKEEDKQSAAEVACEVPKRLKLAFGRMAGEEQHLFIERLSVDTNFQGKPDYRDQRVAFQDLCDAWALLTPQQRTQKLQAWDDEVMADNEEMDRQNSPEEIAKARAEAEEAYKKHNEYVKYLQNKYGQTFGEKEIDITSDTSTDTPVATSTYRRQTLDELDKEASRTVVDASMPGTLMDGVSTPVTADLKGATLPEKKVEQKTPFFKKIANFFSPKKGKKDEEKNVKAEETSAKDAAPQQQSLFAKMQETFQKSSQEENENKDTPILIDTKKMVEGGKDPYAHLQLQTPQASFLQPVAAPSFAAAKKSAPQQTQSTPRGQMLPNANASSSLPPKLLNGPSLDGEILGASSSGSKPAPQVSAKGLNGDSQKMHSHDNENPTAKDLKKKVDETVYAPWAKALKSVTSQVKHTVRQTPNESSTKRLEPAMQQLHKEIHERLKSHALLKGYYVAVINIDAVGAEGLAKLYKFLNLNLAETASKDAPKEWSQDAKFPSFQILDKGDKMEIAFTNDIRLRIYRHKKMDLYRLSCENKVCTVDNKQVSGNKNNAATVHIIR